MKKVLFTNPDGSVGIICPAPKSQIEAIQGLSLMSSMLV